MLPREHATSPSAFAGKVADPRGAGICA